MSWYWSQYTSATHTTWAGPRVYKFYDNVSKPGCFWTQPIFDLTSQFQAQLPSLYDGTRTDATGPHLSGMSDLIRIPGDANLDWEVNDEDASILGAHWLAQSGASWFDGDFNYDQKVDDADAAIMAAHWSGTVEDASVPEPSTIALLLGAVVSLLVWRRRG